MANQSNDASTFTDTSIITSAALDYFKVISQIVKTYDYTEVEYQFDYTVDIDIQRLKLDSILFGKGVSRTAIDKAKLFDKRVTHLESRETCLSMIYVYNYYIAYKYGYYSSSLILDSPLYLFPGNEAFMKALVRQNFYQNSKEKGRVYRKLDISAEQHRLNLTNLKSAFPFLNIDVTSDDPNVAMGNDSYLDECTFRLKAYAQTQKGIGLDYWFNEIGSIGNSTALDLTSGFVGNVAFKDGLHDTLLIPPQSVSEGFSLEKDFVAINTATFITLVKQQVYPQVEGFGSISPYQEVNWLNSQRMMRYEVKAITRMDCGNMNPNDGNVMRNLSTWPVSEPPHRGTFPDGHNRFGGGRLNEPKVDNNNSNPNTGVDNNSDNSGDGSSIDSTESDGEAGS